MSKPMNRLPSSLPVHLTSLIGREREVAAARVHLGEQAFAAAWARGHTMTPEQVLAAKVASLAQAKAFLEE